jgi:hypothetical protein
MGTIVSTKTLPSRFCISGMSFFGRFEAAKVLLFLANFDRRVEDTALSVDTFVSTAALGMNAVSGVEVIVSGAEVNPSVVQRVTIMMVQMWRWFSVKHHLPNEAVGGVNHHVYTNSSIDLEPTFRCLANGSSLPVSSCRTSAPRFPSYFTSLWIVGKEFAETFFGRSSSSSFMHSPTVENGGLNVQTN